MMDRPLLMQRLLLVLVISGTLQQNRPVGDVILLLTRYKLISPLALLSTLKVVECWLDTFPTFGNSQSPVEFGAAQQAVLSVMHTTC